MNYYCHLPREQRCIQRLVDEFNGEEWFRCRLESKRRERRLRYSRLTPAQRKILELLESVLARSPQDCVGLSEDP